MEKFRYFRNLIASKLIVSDENKEQVIRILCKILFGNEIKVSMYSRNNYNYLFIGDGSLKISQNPDTFKNSNYKEISVEEILNPKIERAFTKEELLESIKDNGGWVRNKFSSDIFLITGISSCYVTIANSEISVDALLNYYEFLNGKPCGVSLTLEEALQNL